MIYKTPAIYIGDLEISNYALMLVVLLVLLLVLELFILLPKIFKRGDYH